jgi:hypothetical protein
MIINDLKRQLAEKDAIIANLLAQLAVKSQ